MTRLLTKEEIENMLSFIKPQPTVPIDTAMSVVNMNKNKLRGGGPRQKGDRGRKRRCNMRQKYW